MFLFCAVRIALVGFVLSGMFFLGRAVKMSAFSCLGADCNLAIAFFIWGFEIIILPFIFLASFLEMSQDWVLQEPELFFPVILIKCPFLPTSCALNVMNSDFGLMIIL